MIETYEQYIERLRRTKKLPEEIKEKAIKKLTIFRNRASNDPKNKAISYIKINKNPHLYQMFEWSKTKDGAIFWEKIANAGF